MKEEEEDEEEEEKKSFKKECNNTERRFVKCDLVAWKNEDEGCTAAGRHIH